MAKTYENKAVNGELVMVNFDTDIQKRKGGTYKGTEVIFKAYGKVNEKGIPEKTFEFKPDLRSQLEALNPKDAFTMNLYREEGTKFWNVDSFTKGHTNQAPSSAGTGQARTQQGSNFSGVNPAIIGQVHNQLFEQGLIKSNTDVSRSNPVVIEAVRNYIKAKEELTFIYENLDSLVEDSNQANQQTNVAPDQEPNDELPF